MEYSMKFISKLEEYPSTRNLDNIYQDPLKAKHLDVYLSSMKMKNPKALLLGACPTFNGSRKTGIPFTDEFYVGKKKVDIEEEVVYDDGKTLLEKPKKWEKHKTGRKERGSKIIWENLSLELDEMLLWNIFPFYPHRANAYAIQRKLSDREMEVSYEFLMDVLNEFPTITTILVASDLAAKILKNYPELRDRYDFFYVSSPAVSKEDEFIARVKMALKYKNEIMEQADNPGQHEISYEYRRRWADMNLEETKFFCRMLNRILPIEKEYYCDVCPCNLGESFYCGYYAFNRTDVDVPLEDVKRRNDLIIGANLAPLFPDYIKRTKLADVIVEQALQFTAPYYRNVIHEPSGDPYMIHILTCVKKVQDYLEMLTEVNGKDVLAALVLARIYHHNHVSSAKILHEFGPYVLSLIDPANPEHEANREDLFEQLKQLKIPQDVMDLMNILEKE